MQSIKPGRGPSLMGAVGGIFAVIFGIGWTVLAFSITRNVPFPLIGVIFPLFGVCFVILGIVSVVYELRNTVAKDRLSVVDITTDVEEPDPLNQVFGRSAGEHPQAESSVEQRLKRLDELKAHGTISAQEFETQRHRILGEI